jgi:AraC-like DNA-binding protein
MKPKDFTSAERLENVTDRLNLPAAFRVLGDVLEGLRFRGAIFFRSMLAAPWGVSFDTDEVLRFHIALRGGFFVGREGDEMPVDVQESDIVMLPKGNAHWIADRPGRRLVSSAAATESCELGAPLFQNDEITNNVMCALVQFDRQVTHPLLDALPGIIHIQEIEPNSLIWRLVALIDEEIDRSESLSDPVIDRLTEALFLQLLREFLARAEALGGFIAALRDHRLSRALQLIHQRMGEDWTLATLAEEIGMSRATLVRRFKETIGVAPIEYLTHWRLLKAHDLVKYSNDSLERVAERVGFASAQTLARSFKRHFGYTPSSLRRSSDITGNGATLG